MPRLLRQTAAWSWRLLLTGLVIYLAFRLVVFLRLVTLPFIAALLFTALLQPLAAGCAGAVPFAVVHLVLLPARAADHRLARSTLVANQISADYPTLFTEAQRTATRDRALAGRTAVPPERDAGSQAQL